MRRGRINNSEINNEELSEGIKIVNNYKERKKKERDKRIKETSKVRKNKEEKNYTKIKPFITCIIFVLVIFITYIFFNYGPLFGISINRNIGIDDKNKIDIVSTDSDIYNAYCSDLLIYSNQKIMTYNSRGKKNWEYELSSKFTPNIYIKEKFMIVSNNSNGKIYLFEDKKEILNTKIDGQIDEIFLDSNGNYVVEYSTSGYKKVLGVYSKKGKNLYNAYLSSNPIVNLKILNNAKQLVIVQTNTDTFKLGLTISIIDSSNDNQINTIATLDNNFIYDLTIQKRNIIMLLDDRIVKCNIDTKDMVDIYNFDSSQMMFVSLSNNYYSTLSKELSQQNSGGYSIVSSRFDNTNISTTKIEDSPKMFKSYKVLNYLVYQDFLQVVNKWGIEVKNIKLDFPPKNVVVFNDGKTLALIYSNKIYNINI